MKVKVSAVKSLQQIPFLPIAFFKSHTVVSNANAIQETFSSSGTSGQITSRHCVTDSSIYEESYRKGFAQFYGNIEDYVVLALLPSYLEREGSSLIYMFKDLIEKTNHPESGFYLNEYQSLTDTLISLDKSGQNVLLIGVTYALLDLIEQQQFQLNNTFIMETGGMKGKRKEMIREELHDQLCKGFGVTAIHSEYGMTELLSQATISRNEIDNGIDIVSILNEKTGFFKSNGEARRALSANSIAVNKEKVTEDFSLSNANLINNQFVLLQSGKKNYFVIRVV